MGRMLDNAWVVCGPESSGSAFLAKTLSFALKKCSFFGEYSGYGYNSNTSCENLVLHHSIPYMRPRKWDTDLMQEVSRFSPQFRRVNYVLTTRCKQISILSKCRRFGDTMHAANDDYQKSIPFFQSLTENPSTFIWNYETMVLPKGSYFKRLYLHFGIDSNFVPAIKDDNAPYFN